MRPSESAQANKTGKSNPTAPQIYFSNVDVDKEPVKVASTIFKTRTTFIIYLCMCMFFILQLH